MFFFCHDSSAPWNRGGKFVCGYLPKDRYVIVFYMAFCLSMVL